MTRMKEAMEKSCRALLRPQGSWKSTLTLVYRLMQMPESELRFNSINQASNQSTSMAPLSERIFRSVIAMKTLNSLCSDRCSRWPTFCLITALNEFTTNSQNNKIVKEAKFNRSQFKGQKSIIIKIIQRYILFNTMHYLTLIKWQIFSKTNNLHIFIYIIDSYWLIGNINCRTLCR